MNQNSIQKNESPQSAHIPGIIPQIQVTLNCNQDCTYCFQQHRGKIISLETVEKILLQTVRFNADRPPFSKDSVIEIYWHGGEPLLAGIDFFRQIVKLQSNFPEVKFNNRVQTNGTLMTTDLAWFFSEHKFDVGFSLDGPEHIHNLHRKFKDNGIGTFNRAMEGIEIFSRVANIDKVPVICVVTKDHMEKADELFSFFKGIKASVQLDIYDIRVADILSSMHQRSDLFRLAPSTDRILNFLTTLFDLWFYDHSRRADFTELRNEVKMILQPERNLGDPFHKKRCDIRRTIFDPDGNIFSCDQYLNDEHTAFGNIHADSLEQAISKKFDLWESIKKHVRKSTENMTCDSCKWGNQCNGGCITCMKYNAGLIAARKMGLPAERWFEAPVPEDLLAISGEFYFCDALKGFRDHVKKAVDLQLNPDRQL